MKVLQLIDTLDAGGAERMAVTTANMLASHNKISIICATRRGGDLEKNALPNVRVEILHKKRIFDFTAIKLLWILIRKYDIQIIHAHSTSLFMAVLAKLRYPYLRIVWHNHFGNSKAIKGFRLVAYKFLTRFIDVSIALNEELLSWSKRNLHAKRDVIINNFVELDTCSDLTSPLGGINGSRVLCLANLRAEKNHLSLLEAFKSTIANYPNWSLHLVGEDKKDMYSDQIYAHIKTLHLEDNVFIYGTRSDISAILAHCDVGVLVSTFEAEPLALIEYGYAGLPVIVTDVGKCKIMVGDAGLVIDQSTKQLQVALEQLLESPKARVELGARFRERIKTNYNKTHAIKKLLSLYSTLIE